MEKEKHAKESMKDEIRREFQLERMVLFSDAVFAIVITLMAIEIHLPDNVRFTSNDDLKDALIHILPNIIAYSASFLYIGFTWYQHLQVFSLLKDYDKGLVFRNLLMLFFIGFFPFCASLVARPNNGVYLSVLIYFAIILITKTAQLSLQHYILVKRPQLRINADIQVELRSYHKSRLAIILLVVMFFLTSGSMYLIQDPEMKGMAWIWFFFFPILLRFFQRRKKK
ncbi:MAG: TMEM175 family protein [Bacteroidetes bacterium]|nr:TMEM175 family protein [Bacteroidota bacterium]